MQRFTPFQNLQKVQNWTVNGDFSLFLSFRERNTPNINYLIISIVTSLQSFRKIERLPFQKAERLERAKYLAINKLIFRLERLCYDILTVKKLTINRLAEIGLFFFVAFVFFFGNPQNSLI